MWNQSKLKKGASIVKFEIVRSDYSADEELLGNVEVNIIFDNGLRLDSVSVVSREDATDYETDELEELVRYKMGFYDED